ncbi:ankrin repeat containing protein [Coprinopsis cinerea okayama7|uniref:Ankrin repeat containing protein n=1 Tax=Coprinopsis cinerea (strain Okayama-7 / 130 / ATCC MYA-4618 / FGSC 9003) TaxID=240176 RepID=A8NAJ8_COPC7|nr:ankrin repeat containing protein [Coprinopsis cinerea okayama7\|eukprot:XP_001831850.2 ankrin repeat containing protein [Coprinopsis cinerea okayama7\
MVASKNGHEGTVQRLLAHKDTRVNLTNKYGRTALMFASIKGHEGTVQRLLAHKDTQVNLADNYSQTALMLASENGHEGTVQCLLAHKDTQVNLADNDNDGGTGLMLASENGHEGHRSAPARAQGHPASRYGHEGSVQRLLAQEDTQVNLTGNFGQTALMLASENGREGTVQRLLAHKDTQVNLANNNGWPALMYASLNGHEGTVQRLLAHKDTQVNLANNDGETALMHALNPGLSMPEWYRPHWYSQWDQKLRQKLLALFLGHSEIDANAARKDGDTALILAARDGRSEAVSLLLQHQGINVHHKNKKGQTALAVARKGKPERYRTGTAGDYEAIVKMLTEFERRYSSNMYSKILRTCTPKYQYAYWLACIGRGLHAFGNGSGPNVHGTLQHTSPAISSDLMAFSITLELPAFHSSSTLEGIVNFDWVSLTTRQDVLILQERKWGRMNPVAELANEWILVCQDSWRSVHESWYISVTKPT